MKKNIHPDNYRLVVFKDMSNGDTFVTKSCADTKETIKIDGTEYPLIKREISSTSHPFYTGKMKLVDTAGRVDKFYKKFGKSSLSTKTNTIKDSSSDPVVEDPVVEDPVVEDPVVEDLVVEDPVAEDPVAEDSVAEELVVEDPVAEEPVAESSSAESSSAESSSAESSSEDSSTVK